MKRNKLIKALLVGFALTVFLLLGTKDSVLAVRNSNLLYHPTGLTCGEDGKTLYVSDTGNNQIKMITKEGASVLAGLETPRNIRKQRRGGYIDGKVEEAAFRQPTGIRTVKNGLLVADTGNHAIRYIDIQKQAVFTYAGTGTAGSAGGNRTEASFCEPYGIDVSYEGDIYIADTGNNCIRKIDKNGQVTVYAGVPTVAGMKDGKSGEALFNRPMGLVYDAGVLYVADTGNQRIRKVVDGKVTTLAGNGTEYYEGSNRFIGDYADGKGQEASFDAPVNITVDGAGNLYVSDATNSKMRKIAGDAVTTVDVAEPLISPSGLFVSRTDGHLYVADKFYNKIVKVPLTEPQKGIPESSE